jgi:hypothetical protein
MQVVYFGISMMAVPEGARALAISLERLRRTALLSSATLTAGAAAWGIVVLLIPSSMGNLLLRDAWGPARALVVPLLLATVANMGSYGGGLGLRALAAARRSLNATLTISVLTLVLGIAGAAYGGPSGCAWALLAVAIAGVVAWWYSFLLASDDFAQRSVTQRSDLATQSRAANVVGVTEPATEPGVPTGSDAAETDEPIGMPTHGSM